MAKIKAEKLNPTRAKFSVTVTQDDLQPFMKDAYKSIANQVSIPGFRKGRVPAPIIDQRVGKEAVIQEAVNASLDHFFQQALAESDERPIGRPTADVEKWLDPKDAKSELVLAFEVEVRPEFKVPVYSRYKITVDNAEIGKDAEEKELTKLRESFGELKDVDRPAGKDDYVNIDLVATIDGKEVDRAEGVSYKVGAGNMLDGLDDAIETLTAGEKTTFNAPLLGGEYEGQNADIEITVTAVQERELAEANDEFAQNVSEFDTLDELKKDIKKMVARRAVFEQGVQARDIFIEKLLDGADVPVSEELLNEELAARLEQEGKTGDADRETELREEIAKQQQLHFILEDIIVAEEVEPTQADLGQYLESAAQQYGIEPGQLAQILSQNGQIQNIVGEVARNKALTVALRKVNVVDNDGKEVDLSEFTKLASDEEAAEKDAKKEAKKDADKGEKSTKKDSEKVEKGAKKEAEKAEKDTKKGAEKADKGTKKSAK